MLLKGNNYLSKSFLLPLFLIGVFLVVSFFNCSFNHYDPWTGAKLYPTFAVFNLVDLYNCSKSPIILTVYGPCSSLFYLPAVIGNEPQSCMWIALSLNIFVLLFFLLVIFLLFHKSPTLTFLYLGISFLFYLTLDKTTISLFQIHHDLPTAFYLFLFFAILFYPKRSHIVLFVASFVLWMSFWTKITALPWLFLPLLIKKITPQSGPLLNQFSFSQIALNQTLSGLLIFGLLGVSYGFSDLCIHIFGATNAYPWRECISLFGSENETLLPNDFSSKVLALLRISYLYFIDYWWLVCSCIFVFFSQVKSSHPSHPIIWLLLSYFLVLPACLSALAKFGGVENSLLFAHLPAYAAIFLKTSIILDDLPVAKKLTVGLVAFFTVFLSLFSLRQAKGAYRDTSFSPIQLGYEYLITNPDEPVLFALSPLPNYLATGKIHDSGEALTYSTMMNPDFLQKTVGMNDPLSIPVLAFGSPPYSKSFFDKKFNLKEIPSPEGLGDWQLFKASPKNDYTAPSPANHRSSSN